MFTHLDLFGFFVPAYSFFRWLGAGAVLIYFIITNQEGKCGRLKVLDLLSVFALIFFGVYYGSHLFGMFHGFLVEEYLREMFVQDPIDAITIAFSRSQLYGGLVGIVVAILLYCKVFKVSYKLILGLMGPCPALFIFFQRLGCFGAGCCYGVPTHFGLMFPPEALAPAGITLFPTQPVEGGLNLVLFIVLAVLARRWGEQRAFLTMPLFMFCYAAMRFLLEFVRGDMVRDILFLSINQWASIAVMIALAGWYIWFKKREIKT